MIYFKIRDGIRYLKVTTHPGSFGTSSVPGGNEVTIDCVDPMAGVVAGLSIMIICKLSCVSSNHTFHKTRKQSVQINSNLLFNAEVSIQSEQKRFDVCVFILYWQ